jgi:2-dehydro-3-deoxyphosphooctonate aldolase (KDO 8-P synthase)
MKTVQIENLKWSNALPMGLIAGPCVLESEELALQIARHLSGVCAELNVPFIFKASFDKANRTAISGARGMSWQQAAYIFQKIKKEIGCPILTDVHLPEQCAEVAQVADVLQIPALLCRQTDLILAAAVTGKALHIKKGQFLSPHEMASIVKKAESVGNQRLLICERGVCFGYNMLINDMRALPILAAVGYPVIFDATHSVQRPGLLGDKSGGERQFVEALARAAVAVGVAGLFMETHPDPDRALSDGPNMVPLAYVENLLRTIKNIDEVSKKFPYEAFSMSAQA